MNLPDLKFHAVVDWLDLTIKVSKSTNFQSLQAILKHELGVTYHITPLECSSLSGAATEFRIRIQDPKNWNAAKRVLDVINNKKGIIGLPFISAIEISIDAYSKSLDKKALIDTAETFRKYRTHPLIKHQRFAGKGKGSGRPVGNVHHNHKTFSEGLTYYEGDKGDSVTFRIYVKTTDKSAISIPLKKHRARMEVTLSGSNAPSVNFSPISQPFSFNSLGLHFGLRRLKEDAPGYIRAISDYWLNPGQRKERRINRSGPLFYSPYTTADKEANKKIFDALTCLTKRMGQPKWEA